LAAIAWACVIMMALLLLSLFSPLKAEAIFAKIEATIARLKPNATLRQKANRKEMEAFPDHKRDFMAWGHFNFVFLLTIS